MVNLNIFFLFSDDNCVSGFNQRLSQGIGLCNYGDGPRKPGICGVGSQEGKMISVQNPRSMNWNLESLNSEGGDWGRERLIPLLKGFQMFKSGLLGWSPYCLTYSQLIRDLNFICKLLSQQDLVSNTGAWLTHWEKVCMCYHSASASLPSLTPRGEGSLCSPR